MNTKQAVQLIARLQAAWPQRDLTDESVTLYTRMIERFDFDQAAAAIDGLIASDREFLPPAGVVAQACIAQNSGPLLSAEEAYAEFRENMREPDRIEVRGHLRVPLPTWSNPLVRGAGAELAGEVAMFDEHGVGSEYELRKRYCAAYDRLARAFQSTGTLPEGVDPLERSEQRVAGTVMLAGLGRVPVREIAAPQPVAEIGPGDDDEAAEAAYQEAKLAFERMRERSKELEPPVRPTIDPIREGDPVPALPPLDRDYEGDE